MVPEFADLESSPNISPVQRRESAPWRDHNCTHHERMDRLTARWVTSRPQVAGPRRKDYYSTALSSAFVTRTVAACRAGAPARGKACSGLVLRPVAPVV